MVTVTFIDHGGTSRSVRAEEGATLMEVALRNDIPGIDGECGGACSCATCHVYVAPEWRDVVGNASQMEEDMLDFASDVRQNSRLSCQIRIRPELEGLVVHTPVRQG